MRALAKKYGRLMVAAMTLTLAAPQLVLAEEDNPEQPSALAMAGDAVIARPLGVLITAVGVVTYVVTLPFSLAGGNAKAAGKELVVNPAEATFVRCLGCTKSGYHHDTD